MPFGIASAPYYACSFSEEIAIKMREKGHTVLVYCDDFTTFGDTEADCAASAAALEAMLSEIGISIAPGKVDPPAQTQVWLGIEIDTRPGHECFRLPGSRIVAM